MHSQACNFVKSLKNEVPHEPEFEAQLQSAAVGKVFFVDGVVGCTLANFRKEDTALSDPAMDATTVRVPFPRERDAALEADV